MSSRNTLVTLFAFAVLALSACSGDGGPTFVDSAARLCGVEVTAFSRGEIETSARECFLAAHDAGVAAQLFLVETRSGTVWMTQAGQIRVLNASQDERDPPSQVGWSCTALEATDDELIFRATGCTDPTDVPAPPGDTALGDDSILLCGAEVVVHYREHHNEDARRCFLQAFEVGNRARLFSTMTTIEGDPITEIYTISADGGIDVFVDSRDKWGKFGLFTYTCSTLTPDDPPLRWRLDSCTEREPF